MPDRKLHCRPRLGLLLLCFWIFGTPLAGESPESVLGTWVTPETENGYSHIEIHSSAQGLKGRIVWLSSPTYPLDDPKGMGGRERIDRENPDPALRQRPILGLELMGGFRHVPGKGWIDGEIYDPESGKTYKAKMKLGPDGALHLRGYVGFSLIGRTSVWRRLEEGSTTP